MVFVLTIQNTYSFHLSFKRAWVRILMDITPIFTSLLPRIENTNHVDSSSRKPPLKTFTGIIQASQIFGQIREMELLLEKSKKTYIDYDRYLRPGYAFKATDDDVKRFENEIVLALIYPLSLFTSV